MWCVGNVRKCWCCPTARIIRKFRSTAKVVIKGSNIKYVGPVDHAFTKMLKTQPKFIYAPTINARNQAQENKTRSRRHRPTPTAISNPNKSSKGWTTEYLNSNNKPRTKIKNIAMSAKFVWINRRSWSILLVIIWHCVRDARRILRIKMGSVLFVGWRANIRECSSREILIEGN